MFSLFEIPIPLFDQLRGLYRTDVQARWSLRIERRKQRLSHTLIGKPRGTHKDTLKAQANAARILVHVLSNPGVTSPAIQSALGMGENAVNRRIVELITSGKLAYSGEKDSHGARRIYLKRSLPHTDSALPSRVFEILPVLNKLGKGTLADLSEEAHIEPIRIKYTMHLAVALGVAYTPYSIRGPGAPAKVYKLTNKGKEYLS